MAGFVIFSVLGYMAHVQKKSVADVGLEGNNLCIIFSTRFGIYRIHLKFLFSRSWLSIHRLPRSDRNDDRISVLGYNIFSDVDNLR